MTATTTAGARAWVFGDDISTDALAPSAYLIKRPEEMAAHCLEGVAPEFVAGVRPGDAFVAGANLGVGSSREQAAQVLQILGISVLVAKSFGRIFYRNALNIGVPALICPQADSIRPGDHLDVNPGAGTILIRESGMRLACEPLPPNLLAMIADGGLLPHLRARAANRRASPPTS